MTHESLRIHARYLADTLRLERYGEAIEAVVKSGDVVVDLGAGSGILGLLACRAGASRVYVIDDGAPLELARMLYRDNGYLDRAVFLAGHSTRVDLPERVDVVLADQIAYFGYGAGLFDCFRDAQERFLKPEGVLLPTAITLTLVGVESPRLEETLTQWSTESAGFDTSAGRELHVASTPWDVALRDENFLTVIQPGAEQVLGAPGSCAFSVEACTQATRDGVLHGLGGWFDAHLGADVHITNSPLAPDRVRRSCGYFPLDPPVELTEGQRVRLHVQVDTRSRLATWSVETDPAVGPREVLRKHSTLACALMTKAMLQRQHPSRRLSLSARGQVARAVLELLDGSRTLADVRTQLTKDHAGTFGTDEQIAAFLHDLLAAWAE